MVEPSLATSSGLTSAKRRRRTRYTPLPGIMEHAVYVAPSDWPQIRHDIEKIQHHALFNELGAAVDDHPVVFTEALPNP